MRSALATLSRPKSCSIDTSSSTPSFALPARTR
jgi:hypothetical protein